MALWLHSLWNYGQLRGIDQEYPKHMRLWQGLFFDPLWSLFSWVWNVLKPWGEIIRPQPCHFFYRALSKKCESKLWDLGNPSVFHGFPKIFKPSHPSWSSFKLDQLTEVAQLPGGLQALWWKRRSKTECSRDVGLRFLVEWAFFCPGSPLGTGRCGMIMEIARWV